MKTLKDAALPGLSDALEAGSVLERLRHSWAPHHQPPELAGLSVINVQYQPRKRCSILYSLKYRQEPGGRSQKVPLSGLLLPTGEPFPDVPAQAMARQRLSGVAPLPSPALGMPDLGMVLYVFPMDTALPTLPDAINPLTMKASLGRLWKQHGARVSSVQVQTLGYTPGARAALRYDVQSAFRSSGLSELRRLVGKIDASRDAPQIFRRSWSLWRAAAGRPGFAPPVGYDVALNLYLQEWVPGDRLANLASGARFVGLVRQTARTVAMLHGLDVPVRSCRTPEKEARTAHRWGSSLAAIRPQQRRRIRKLRDRLAAELEQQARITGVVHGDLHPSNIIAEGDRVTLIDLDNTARGDRLLDVGRFLSALRTSSLRLHGTASGLSEAGESFLEQYLTVTGEDVRRARLFEAAALLTSAGTGFRLQRAGWEHSADALIDETERVLGLAGKGKQCSVQQAGTPAAPIAIDRRRWAMDSLYVMSALALPVRQHFHAELTSCTTEWRRGTSAHGRLRYRLRGWRHGARWSQSTEGFLRNTGGGRGAAQRLAALVQALDGRPTAPQLPRLVAYVPEIGLLVMTVPHGLPLAKTEKKARGKIGALLARTLATVHQTKLDLDRTHAPEQELVALQQHAQSDAAQGSLFAQILEQVEHRMRRVSTNRGPVLRRFDPRHVVYQQNRIGFSEVQDVVLSHPLLDVGDCLARLSLLSLEADEPAGLLELATALRRQYPADNEEISVFEAAALLKLSSSLARRHPESDLAARLASMAANALDPTTHPTERTA